MNQLLYLLSFLLVYFFTLGSLLHANSNFGFQGNAGDDLATNDDEDWAQAGAPLQSAGQMRRRAI